MRIMTEAVREGVMTCSESKFLNLGVLHNMNRELPVSAESCFVRK